MPKTFEDLQRWTSKFDAPERDEYQEVDKLLSRVMPGGVAIDVGSSTGFFTIRLAPLFECVYAVDVEKAASEFIAARCQKAGILNVVPVVGRGDGFTLPGSEQRRADFVLCCNTLHHIASPSEYFAQVREQCCHGGTRLLLIDWLPGRLEFKGEEFGPKEAWGVKIDATVAIKLMADAGWALVSRMDTKFHWNLFFSVNVN